MPSHLLAVSLLAFTSSIPQPELRARALPRGRAIAAGREAELAIDPTTEAAAVTLPPASLVASAPPPEPGEQRLTSMLGGIPPIFPSLALAAAFVVWATKALGSITGLTSIKLIFAGAVAGVISRSACAPLEMVSTLMMCRGGESDGMWVELQKAWKNEGIKGLFKGNGANCLKVAPQRGTQFLVYESVKKYLATAGMFGIVAGAPLSPLARLCAGGIAGMAAAIIVYPLEVIKTLRTVYPDECNGLDETFSCVVKYGGLKSFYSGLTPTLVAMFPYVGFEFMVYETLKRNFEVMTGAGVTTAALLLIGALSGAAGQASAHPLDVVRRRMQMGFLQKRGLGAKTTSPNAPPPITNMFQGLYSIVKNEGFFVLFRGLGPACLEKVPSTAIGYYIYEAMKTSLRVASF